MNALYKLQVRKHGKGLREILARAEDEAFVRMIWAVDALQSGRPQQAAQCLQFPTEAAGSKVGDKYKIHKWELETLVIQLLVTPKGERLDGPHRITNCSFFAAAASAVNRLRKKENYESALYLPEFGVLNDLHRIAQRTFPWQRGYFRAPEFYRYAYIYGQGECREYFERKCGLTLNEFSLIGFGLFAAFQERSWLRRDYSMQDVGIAPAAFEEALKLLAVPIVDARSGELNLMKSVKAQELPTAFKPSLLRRFPIISFGSANERLLAPLPELIAFRITSGIYYDLVSGPGHLRNEAAARFEKYCSEYISAMLPGLEVLASRKYKHGSDTIDTPDLLLRRQNKVVAIIECKATKLTFGAQFAVDPLSEAKYAYDQIVNGVVQIWRHFSHVRRDIIRDESVSPQACGMVLTLDTWLDVSTELRNSVIASAATLAEESDPEIIAEDRRGVFFCAIQELERTLCRSDADMFLRTMSNAIQDKFAGWHLPSIHRETHKELPGEKEFPFRLDEVLPWWKTVDELSRRSHRT